ncbi:DUF2007 domain-containing protein [uncultured Alsobacter sp.]|uniref:putative signal transducing protein n=1 Tax=uncultured Alsobacter sp. TaxID=1748258 RepID=UPI0025E90BDC|nr:DUF2007 domain-containing protein [uncultured Alsobacter sp.]
MIPVLRTNDIVLLSLAEAILQDADVACFVADQHMSAIEGSIGAFPRRLLVPADEVRQARRLLTDAGLAAELLPAQEP